MLLTILKTPPPTSFLYLTSAMSGSIPVVSQSIMNAIVPVGARTVVWPFLNPYSVPSVTASAHAPRADDSRSPGTYLASIPSACDWCLRITPMNGSRFRS